MRVTLKEIAKEVGMSPSTVSFALRGKRPGKRSLAPETVELIRKTAKSMGYRPNTLASSLRNNTTHMIGVLVPALLGDFYEKILFGISQSIGPSYTPALAVSNYDGLCERSQLEVFISKQVDGLISAFSGSKESIEIYRELSERYDTPIVLVDRGIPGLNLPVVRSDHYGQTHNAVITLQELGHKRITYISYAPELECMELRRQGYIAAMRERNLEDYVKVISKPKTIKWSKEELKQFAKEILDDWQTASPAATALIIHNDWLAYEVLAECRVRGIKVPADLSIMGLDNCSPSSLAGIELSTVAQEPTMIGYKAGELLLKLIRGQAWDGQPIVLPTKVIRRNTTKAI